MNLTNTSPLIRPGAAIGVLAPPSTGIGGSAVSPVETSRQTNARNPRVVARIRKKFNPLFVGILFSNSRLGHKKPEYYGLNFLKI
jgi:hypothetical protein